MTLRRLTFSINETGVVSGMDTLAHALYGVALFSRTGLAGGRRGAVDAAGRRRPFYRDWTVYAAFGFGLLPDVCSLGVYFTQSVLTGHPPSFHHIPPYVFLLYKLTHSLLIAGVGCGLIGLLVRPLLVPSLSWMLHIVMDLLTHGLGRFQTPLFFPVTGFSLHFYGINWWTHSMIIVAYDGLLILIALGIHFWRQPRGG